MKKLLLVLLVALMASSCDTMATTPPPSEPTISREEQILLDEGYTDIKSLGPAFLGCSEDDSIMFSGHYEAKNANGKTVKITLCGGLFKGYTIRHQ